MQKKSTKGKEVVFFERGSWYHRTKTINDDFTIKYGKKGGFQTAEEAEDHYWEERERFDKEISQYRQKQNTQFSFAGYLTYWFHNVFLARVESSIKIGFSYVLYHIIRPNITNDVLLTMVTTEYIDVLLERCSKHSESAGVQTQKFLRIAFKDAMNDGYIKTNPMASAKRYYATIPKIQILTKEQIKTLLTAASCNQTLYLEVLLALFCGLRKGEILGLKFTDFNREERFIHISRQITRNYTVTFDNQDFHFTSDQSVKPPKSRNSNRVIKEVPAVIFDELDKRVQLIDFWKQKNGCRYDHTNDEFVMVSRLGKIKSSDTINAALSAICVRNGLPHITVHGLRHMFATILIEQGLTLLKISRLLGHQSIHTTFEIYCGVMEGKNDIRDFVDEAFDPGKSAYSLEEVDV